MFHVEKMVTEDFAFAVELTDTVKWGFVEEDFRFMTRLEPEGCFVLYNDSARIGIATTISYSKTGWFGNLIVRKDFRKKGAGSFLVKHSLEYLFGRNVKSVGLYAYIDKIPFYETLGFTGNADYEVLRTERLFPFKLSNKMEIREASEEDLKSLVEFDRLCFGDNRERLLKTVMSMPRNICYMAFDEGRLLGYAIAKVYEGVAEVGPLGCGRKRSNVELSLLQSIFSEIAGFDVSLCVPKRESNILGFVKKCGFSEVFPVVRMLFNPSIDTDCITIAESLERG